jgi:predicted MPP superfamily phosphohydrolase
MRDFAVLVPLIAAQMAICLALGQSRRVSIGYGVFAGIAVLANLLSIFELMGLRMSNSLAWIVSWTDVIGETVLFTSTAAFGVYLVCRWMGRRLPEKVSQERRRLLGALAVASPVVAVGYGIVIGRTDFGVREVTIPIAGLHPDLEGLRILQLSDIHRGQFLSARELERVIDMTRGLKPHLAIMTGDLISKPGDPMEECVQQLARVRADAGMYGCLGNHEMYARAEAAVKAEAAKYGILFLRHEQRQIRFGNAVMNIGGVDYQKSSDRRDYLKGADKLVAPGALNVLLSHNPDVFPKAAEQGWNLTLAGHTHGGQVTFEIVEQSVNIARFITPYVAGEYHLGTSSCYVTRGVGTVGVPVRMGIAPEITLLRLRKA